MIRPVAWVLLGVVIGACSTYFVSRPSQSNGLQPNNPDKVAFLFKQAIDDNDLSTAHSLMTPYERQYFTSHDLQTLRQSIQVGTAAEGGATYDTYTVVTVGNQHAVTLWVSPTQNNDWLIQRITSGALAPSSVGSNVVWIEYARYTASQIHENPTYWVLTNAQVTTHVGQYLGAIDDPSTQSGWHSNQLSAGTKFFEIFGVSPSRAFAVQMPDGSYTEAVLVGSNKPG